MNLISIEEEILMALQNEEVVDIESLDLETFKQYGNFSDDEVKHLIHRFKENRKK